MTDKTLLYAADTFALKDERAFSAALAIVSEERRKKTLDYRFDKDKRLSLCAELLLKKALADFGVTEKRLRFSYGENGKPFLDDTKDVFFNISHSEEYVLCAVSDSNIGCDIEKIKNYKDNLAKRIFSEREYADINSKPTEEEKKAAFFMYWTLSESYMKYTGLGLQLPLSSFELTSENGFGVIKNGERQNVFMQSFSDIPGYVCAICSQAPLNIAKPVIISVSAEC